MNKQVISISMTNETNEILKQSFALGEISLIACSDVGEAIRLLSLEPYSLIIFNAVQHRSEKVQEDVIRLRKLTYAQMLVLTSVEMIAVTMEVGADVCIPQSADIYSIFSQSMALIRRHDLYDRYDSIQPGAGAFYRGDLAIDLMRHCVERSGKVVNLEPREFRLLVYFARNPGIVLAPEQIDSAVWMNGYHSAQDVSKVVSALRHKLNDNREAPRYIQTVRGAGYRFLPQD